MLEKYESRRIRVDIRHVLLDVWDPIGVRDEPHAQDEYDSYIGDIYEMLTKGAGDEKITDYLWWVVKERMGLGGAQTRDAMTETVDALRRIPLPAQPSP
jgi:hypothetical protein